MLVGLKGEVKWSCVDIVDLKSVSIFMSIKI